MIERRPLAAGLSTVPDADPDEVRQFVLQERKPVAVEAPELTLVPDRSEDAAEPHSTRDRPRSRRRPRPAGVAPIGLIPVTLRLRPGIAGALKRASLERQLVGTEPFIQQEIVEHLLEPWLRREGFLP